MSSAIHIIPTTTPPTPGYSRYTSGTISRSRLIRIAAGSPCVSTAYYRTLSQIQASSLKCSFKKVLVCRATSSGQRRNQDFPRQNKHGFSRSRNRQNGERHYNFENLEEHESVSSKNGSLLTSSDAAKFHNVTATPGPKEDEIVKLFREVQAQLRDRATPVKEEKKIETLETKNNENKTVDSLLKLLRKHSVEQSKRSRSNSSGGELTNNRSTSNGQLNEEKSNVSFKTESPAPAIEELKPRNAAAPSRPVSKFQKKSPVPQAKLQPVYTTQDAAESLHKTKKESIIQTNPDNLDIEPEPELENLLTNMTIIHEASSSSDEENEESEIEEENEPYRDEEVDFSSLKLTELRALAKVRGFKGYSKLKKSELVKMLS